MSAFPDLPGHVFADLHTHSTFSDGTRSPEDIVGLAAEQGLGAVAVTDHDSLEGARAALAAGAGHGIDVVCGVEISTQTDARDVHLLGYFVDLEDDGLSAAFAESRARRQARALEMADRLGQAGFGVSGAELLSTGQTPNRSNLARLLVSKGQARDVNDAFERLIGDDGPYFVPNAYIPTVDAIGLVRAAGGFAFLAHPALYHVVDLVPAFADAGLAGIEAYHTLQDRGQADKLAALASQLGLAVSGGSDWHGDEAHGARLGGAGLDEEGYRAFLAACGRS